MVNSTKEIIVIFAWELHKQTDKETDGTKTAQSQKATLTTQTGIQSKPCTSGATTDQLAHQQEFVPSLVGWSSNPST